MKTIRWINFVLLFLLGLATGLVKVFGLEADVKIFASLGFVVWAVRLVGAVQTLAALMLLSSTTRPLGALVLAVSFVLATVAVFASGMIPFGVFSLLFIAMALWIYLHSRKSSHIAT